MVVHQLNGNYCNNPYLSIFVFRFKMEDVGRWDLCESNTTILPPHSCLFFFSLPLLTCTPPTSLSPPPAKRSFGGRPLKICTIFYHLPVGSYWKFGNKPPNFTLFSVEPCRNSHTLQKMTIPKIRQHEKLKLKPFLFFLFSKENKTFKMNEMLLCIHRQETWNW